MFNKLPHPKGFPKACFKSELAELVARIVSIIYKIFTKSLNTWAYGQNLIL